MPDIVYATHQYDYFYWEPKYSHVTAIKHLYNHTSGILIDEIILYPNKDMSFDVFSDANYCETLYHSISGEDYSTYKSCTSYMIIHAILPIIMNSKLNI